MHRIFAFVGPHRSGKSTLIREFLKLAPDSRAAEIKSLTTRCRRGPEDDVFYAFVTRDEFERHIAAHELVQWAEYAENYYGNDRKALDEHLEKCAGFLALVENGVKNFIAAGYELVIIRVKPEGDLPVQDKRRSAEDVARSTTSIPVDFEIVNSFAPGGLQKAVAELATLLIPLL
ncbi:MAG: hypothetical protein WC641_04510 [Patescibacteria group bacterium]